jgi:hypothetical protein
MTVTRASSSLPFTTKRLVTSVAPNGFVPPTSADQIFGTFAVRLTVAAGDPELLVLRVTSLVESSRMLFAAETSRVKVSWVTTGLPSRRGRAR